MRMTKETHPDLSGVSAIYFLRHRVNGQIARIGKTTDLNRRQGNHWGSYPYFTFRRCAPGQLWHRECFAWHHHGGEERSLDGNHPSVPDGYRCPVAGCRKDKVH